jgi:hypothetical protein
VLRKLGERNGAKHLGVKSLELSHYSVG